MLLGPRIMVLGGVATGVANAAEAASAIVIMMGYGLMPIPSEILSPIGAINAKQAVLDIKWVKKFVTKNKTVTRKPMRQTTLEKVYNVLREKFSSTTTFKRNGKC